jgi:hypothetical protein
LTAPDGPDHGLRVRFEKWSEGSEEDEKRGTRILVDATDRGIVNLSLTPETGRHGAGEAARRARDRDGRRRVRRRVLRHRSSTVVRAVLDGETRSLLRSLRVEVELEVVSGELRGRVMEGNDPPGLHGLLLSRTLPLLLEAARRLRWPVDAAARIAHNARRDRDPGVRRENLLALVREYPDAPATRDLLRAAREDSSDDVRVRAAIALGEEGRATPARPRARRGRR